MSSKISHRRQATRNRNAIVRSSIYDMQRTFGADALDNFDEQDFQAFEAQTVELISVRAKSRKIKNRKWYDDEDFE